MRANSDPHDPDRHVFPEDLLDVVHPIERCDSGLSIPAPLFAGACKGNQVQIVL
jgi:hypothetical protein